MSASETNAASLMSEDDDFQDPIPVPIIPVRLSAKAKGKQPMRYASVVTKRVLRSNSSLKYEEDDDASTDTTLVNDSTDKWSGVQSSNSSVTLNEEVLSSDLEEQLDSAAAATSPSSATPLAELDSDSQQEVDQIDEEEDDDDEAESSSSSSSDEEEVVRNRGGARRGGNNTTRRRGRVPHYMITQEKVIKQHEELRTIWDDLETIKAEKVIPVEQPAELTLQLLPFQRYGVGWMLRQEQMETFNGGILADEMGMGKTIQTISLLLSDKKKPNLVIAPTVAILQWKNEIERHTNNALSVYVFHGANKSKDPEFLKNFDVVLSTYSIMETSFRRQEYGVTRKGISGIFKEKSVLHRVNWHRVILDEAHNIKDRSCNTARSVFHVKGTYKWSLTGTPLQNRVGELYSLIRFMQADPFAYYYCKKCPCKELNWKFSDKRTCDSCGHTPMNHVCWWNNEVLKPIQTQGYIGDGRKALKKLRLLLDKIMLRRTKIECADDLGLPPRSVVIRRDLFSEEEEDVYTSLYSDVARTFTTYVEQGTVLNNYANIFELLMKMRQCADHPDLVTKKSSDNKQLVCMLCSDPPEDAIRASCKHVFCRECCIQYLNSFDDEETKERPRCPSCFADFYIDLSQPALEIEGDSMGQNANYSKSSIVNRINMDKWRSSTKIEALFEELSNLRREDKTIKSIVFSQFVNFLDLVYWRLSRAGFECIRLDGTMTPDQRDAAIRRLKAGGVALNLTEASRVFICDPWWNPVSN
ncbi:MAG: SNF2 family N-terminal domain-containing protein [Benjaminiella poitrasii]|nr:MAG: SNF2 family N-terminal domain-containing protein [Benjaminiella poitrasii]